MALHPTFLGLTQFSAWPSLDELLSAAPRTCRKPRCALARSQTLACLDMLECCFCHSISFYGLCGLCYLGRRGLYTAGTRGQRFSWLERAAIHRTAFQARIQKDVASGAFSGPHERLRAGRGNVAKGRNLFFWGGVVGEGERRFVAP